MKTEDTLEWVDLQTFASLEDAADLIDLLKENDMTYNVVEDAHKSGDGLNLEFMNHGISTIHVQVMPKDMPNASRLLELAAGNQVAEVEEDDYISGFSDAELLEVLHKPDEWNRTDVQLALKFLNQRGHGIDEATLQRWLQERLAELEKPELASASLRNAGYALALLGGLIGFLISFQLAYFTKRLPDGRKVPLYGPADRAHGRRIMGISLAVMAVIVAWLVFGPKV